MSIIALLLAILLPSLKRAREQAKMVTCLSNMRGTGQAALTFAAEHRDRMQLVSSELGVEAADPNRDKFAYGAQGEVLCWPVALAQAAGIGYQNNWDWGVRAAKYANANTKTEDMAEDNQLVVCPSDKVRIASPFYPRNEGTDQGLKGLGDPNNPTSGNQENMAYWGFLSYGINEDIAGFDGRVPACWSAAPSGGGWESCRGSYNYPPMHPCGRNRQGHRLRGNLDRVYGPSAVGLLFEAGPEDARQYASMQNFDEFANLIITEAADGPYLGDSQQQFPSRIPTNRHSGGRLNVVFTDGHGALVRPVEYDTNNFYNRLLPSRYASRVRVSPYQAHETD